MFRGTGPRARSHSVLPSVQPDGYLTDGRRLLRVVSQFDPLEFGSSAWLEDCATLEVRAYSPRELAEMGLHRVSDIPAPMLPEQAAGGRSAESRECPTAF